jgi:hypothetical protein
MANMREKFQRFLDPRSGGGVLTLQLLIAEQLAVQGSLTHSVSSNDIIHRR